MDIPLLQVHDLSHSFLEGDERVNALRGVSFEASAGELTSIVGPSGCGKSTLLYLLGLLDQPDSGEIIIDGKEMSKSNEEQRTMLRNQSIGFVFQFHFLIKELTAVENVSLPAQKKGLSKKIALEKASDVLCKLGLESKRERFANKLSGGEQQRVAIARALVNSPALLLADEPTGNLDSANSENVFELLQNLAREQNIAVLMVTHNEEIANRCDKIISIRDGLIIN
ncbi:ABC transporter ATP-binding protein [Candidatus Seribacter sulfatis]|uniref:ABC transporter ATP-binding protein n=1 Tax=Candidatus Seribacter sulfatis TaxID=3381756 RepID=UPI00389A2A62|nr:ABC transporter ATP-binding protein [bacterium]